MEIESPEEFSGSNDHHSQIIKRKRTKRQRPSSPFGMGVTSSSSSGGGGGGGGGGSSGGGSGGGVYYSVPSPTTSSEIYASTEEDEDMANCLILLARGSCQRQMEEDIKKVENFNSQRKLEEMPTTTTTTTTAKAGFYVYECKTCTRTFPSFQALGGHRASHKKSKVMTEEKTFLTLPLNEYEEKDQLFNKMSPPLFVQTPNKIFQNNYQKPKVHECSICGSEFSSGQALGGHMRRHRTHTSTRITTSDVDTGTIESSSHDGEKPRFILPLDLNLPAPEDDDHCDSKFQFTPNQPHLVFSAPALVGCHY